MLLECLQNFPSTNAEVCLKFSPDSFKICTPSTSSAELGMETEISLLVQDFVEFQVDDECELVLDFKELKRFLLVSDMFDCPVRAKFESGNGSLIVFEMNPVEDCSCRFVIASYRRFKEAEETQKAKRICVTNTSNHISTPYDNRNLNHAPLSEPSRTTLQKQKQKLTQITQSLFKNFANEGVPKIDDDQNDSDTGHEYLAPTQG